MSDSTLIQARPSASPTSKTLDVRSTPDEPTVVQRTWEPVTRQYSGCLSMMFVYARPAASPAVSAAELRSLPNDGSSYFVPGVVNCGLCV